MVAHAEPEKAHQWPDTDTCNRIWAVLSTVHEKIRLVDYQKGVVSVCNGKGDIDHHFCHRDGVLHYNGKRYNVKGS